MSKLKFISKKNALVKNIAASVSGVFSSQRALISAKDITFTTSKFIIRNDNEVKRSRVSDYKYLVP